MVLMSVSPINLMNDMSLQVIELQLWLKGLQFNKIMILLFNDISFRH